MPKRQLLVIMLPKTLIWNNDKVIRDSNGEREIKDTPDQRGDCQQGMVPFPDWQI